MLFHQLTHLDPDYYLVLVTMIPSDHFPDPYLLLLIGAEDHADDFYVLSVWWVHGQELDVGSSSVVLLPLLLQVGLLLVQVLPLLDQVALLLLEVLVVPRQVMPCLFISLQLVTSPGLLGILGLVPGAAEEPPALGLVQNHGAEAVWAAW